MKNKSSVVASNILAVTSGINPLQGNQPLRKVVAVASIVCIKRLRKEGKVSKRAQYKERVILMGQLQRTNHAH